MIHVADANACITYLQMLIDSPCRWIYIYTYAYMCIFIHDKSQSFLHIARKTPTNPLSNPPNQETMRITWSFNRSFKLRCSQLPPYGRLNKPPMGRCRNGVMCPFCHLCDRGEKKRRQKVKNARKAALSRGDARHGWPNWRHRHMTSSCGVMNSRGWWTGSNVP